MAATSLNALEKRKGNPGLPPANIKPTDFPYYRGLP
jgi:hypothetical protein